MKTASLLELWDTLRNSPALPGRGFRMRQWDANAYARCFAAISQPDGKPGFVIEFLGKESGPGPIDYSTRSFSVDYGTVDGIPAGSKALTLTLHDQGLSDLFALLCSDLRQSVISESATGSALRGACSVLGRWKLFLQRRSALMTQKEVRGLIGELVTLARLAGMLGNDHVVQAWKGPLDGIRDFESDLVYAEVKTFTPSPEASVRISDPMQLVAPPGHLLKLVCVPLQQSPDGASLLQFVEAVESLFPAESAVKDLFRQRVACYGFLPAMAEFLTDRFVASQPRVFVVRDGFPRIRPESVDPGILAVRFSIGLGMLGPFGVPTDAAIGCRPGLTSAEILT